MWMTRITKIWKESNSAYQSMQNISLPSSISVFAISAEKLLIVTSGNIHYFTFDGAQYALQQNMTAYPSLIDGTVTNNLSTIWANDLAKILHQYELQNGSFVEVYTEAFENFALQSIVSPDSLYCILTVLNQTLFILYDCPEECVACVFPNNCTVCMEGY